MKKGKKMRRSTKGIILIFFALVLLLVIVPLIGQKWLEQNVHRIINKNPERAYDISYDALNLNTFLNGFKLENTRITPLNQEAASIITCSIDEVEVNGVSWRDFIFGNNAIISEIAFVKPAFELTLGVKDTVEEASTKKLQKLFVDILSRAKLKRFRLDDGSFVVLQKGDSITEIGHIGKLNLEATEIETDSVQWKYLIPFKLVGLTYSVEDILFYIDEHRTFSCANIEFDPLHCSMLLSGISMKFNKDWQQVSKLIQEQTDLIEVELKSLNIYGIEANSQLYGDIDIRAKTIIIDSLQLRDYRDKNQPRYDETPKPMFSNMVKAIPFSLKVDSILIKNTSISYSERVKGRSTAGRVDLDYLDGSICNLTTVDSFQQEYKEFEVNITGRLNNDGRMNVTMTVPYDVDEFYLKGEVRYMKMTAFNQLVSPMSDVVIKSGKISILKIEMQAGEFHSKNRMALIYDDLKLNVLQEKNKEIKKKGVVSGIANTMIRTHNLPDDKNYVVAYYNTKRNFNRAPFNYLYNSLKEGFLEIVPSKTAKVMMAKKEKKKIKTKKNRKK